MCFEGEIGVTWCSESLHLLFIASLRPNLPALPVLTTLSNIDTGPNDS